MPIYELSSHAGKEKLRRFEFGERMHCTDALILEVLVALSQTILSDRRARQFPDLITFAFQCRRSAVMGMYDRLSDMHLRSGWGTVLHIAPANIPINFAFSFLMGWLSGNSNLVRVPSKSYAQVDLFCELFDEVLSLPRFSKFKNRVIFFKSERSSSGLLELVENVNGLVVWGGDDTVEYFRNLKKLFNCVEVYFPNRVSSVVLGADRILNLTEAETFSACHSLYNDTFLVDQNACSSPSIVFWLGEEKVSIEARNKFWTAFSSYLDKNFPENTYLINNKFINLLKFYQTVDEKVDFHKISPIFWTTKDLKIADKFSRFGLFSEFFVGDIEEMFNVLRKNEQTLTYFGVDKDVLCEKHFKLGSSLNRIVPIGSALNITPHWDGKEVIAHLSNKLEIY